MLARKAHPFRPRLTAGKKALLYHFYISSRYISLQESNSKIENSLAGLCKDGAVSEGKHINDLGFFGENGCCSKLLRG